MRRQYRYFIVNDVENVSKPFQRTLILYGKSIWKYANKIKTSTYHFDFRETPKTSQNFLRDDPVLLYENRLT